MSKKQIIVSAAWLALFVGCASTHRVEQPTEQADKAAYNRVLVRASLAENVYNGVAVERALYPRDFDEGTARLNELGSGRVRMLIDASRHASGRVVIVRGEEADKLYADRVATVRKELADGGVDLDEVAVTAGGHPGGEGQSSGRALITFNRLMSDYQPRQGGSRGSNGVIPTPINNAVSPNQRGQ